MPRTQRGRRRRSGVSKPAHLPLSSAPPPPVTGSATDTAAGLSHHSQDPPPTTTTSSSLTPSLPLRPAHPGGLFSSSARANPRLGVSRASRFLVVSKDGGESRSGASRGSSLGGGQSRPEDRCRAQTRSASKTRRRVNKTVSRTGGKTTRPPAWTRNSQ